MLKCQHEQGPHVTSVHDFRNNDKMNDAERRTSDYDEHHVTTFQPINRSRRSWSEGKSKWPLISAYLLLHQDTVCAALLSSNLYIQYLRNCSLLCNYLLTDFVQKTLHSLDLECVLFLLVASTAGKLQHCRIHWRVLRPAKHQ